MQTGIKGIELIKKFEGCRLKAYKCPAGVWTIGYGHTVGVKPGDELSSIDEATELLREDLVKYEAPVEKYVKVPLNQNQYDALVSLCYNIGAGNLKNSTLLIKLNKGDYTGASYQFARWNRGGGKVLTGLVWRREEERKLFMSQEA